MTKNTHPLLKIREKSETGVRGIVFESGNLKYSKIVGHYGDGRGEGLDHQINQAHPTKTGKVSEFGRNRDDPPMN